MLGRLRIASRTLSVGTTWLTRRHNLRLDPRFDYIERTSYYACHATSSGAREDLQRQANVLLSNVCPGEILFLLPECEL